MSERYNRERLYIWGFVYVISIFVVVAVLLFGCDKYAWGSTIEDGTAIRCIIGEASNQGKQGMYALASGLLNRGTVQGVYGCNSKHIDKEPRWVWKQARTAWNKAKVKTLHDGTHWENIKAFGEPYCLL